METQSNEGKSGTANDIFLSYSHADREFAERLVRLAHERGLSVWFDRGIADEAASWRAELVKQLEGSKAMVFLFSENCNGSTDLIKELGVAGKLNKPVIVVKIGEGEPKNEYLYELVARQWTFLFPDLETKTQPFVDHLAQQWGTRQEPVTPPPAAARPTPPAAAAEPTPPPPVAPPAPAVAAVKPAPQVPAAQRQGDWFPLRRFDLLFLVPLLLVAFYADLHGRNERMGLGFSVIGFVVYLFIIAIRNARLNRGILSKQSFFSYLLVLVAGLSPLVIPDGSDPTDVSGWSAVLPIILLALMAAIPANVLQVVLRKIFMRNLFRSKMAAALAKG